MVHVIARTVVTDRGEVIADGNNFFITPGKVCAMSDWKSSELGRILILVLGPLSLRVQTVTVYGNGVYPKHNESGAPQPE
jgi:hypothetical protein